MITGLQGCGFDLVSNDLMWCLYGFIKNLPETGEMIHGFVEYSLVTYWDELKKVLRAFGDSCKDFDIPDCSEVASELIKEGFTLEFMKNAIIRPILSLRNPQLLLDWWRKVEGGDGGAPPPPEGEVFKSDHYSSFIFLFFKIGTEVNVFSHLGQKLFSHMKEAMFSDTPEEPDSDDDEEEVVEASKEVESDPDVNDSKEETSEGTSNGTKGTEVPNGEVVTDLTKSENASNESPKADEKLEVTKMTEEKVGGAEDKSGEERKVTSMYGKVWTLKPAASS